MKKIVFTGVCTALVTPFLNGEVNYPMLEMLLRRQLDAGVKTVVIAGTTGESATLSDSEKINMFRRAKAYCGNDCTIIAGTGSNNTLHAINLGKAAQSAGADALLVVSPYYNKATPEGLVAHYTAVADAVDIPVILYNVPSRTGLDIPVQVYRSLHSKENIVGVKEASTDITKVARIHNACTTDFSVYSGNDDQIVPVMAFGGKGVISVISNVLPAETLAITNAALRGDYQTAAALQRRLLPLIDLMFCEVNPIPVKAAMSCLGYDCGSCRLPLTELSAENKGKLLSYLT